MEMPTVVLLYDGTFYGVPVAHADATLKFTPLVFTPKPRDQHHDRMT